MKRALPSLVRLFPPAFRERFGPEIAEDLREDWAAVRARGRLPAVAYGIRAALDLTGAALAEHWNPTLRPTPRGAGGGGAEFHDGKSHGETQEWGETNKKGGGRQSFTRGCGCRSLTGIRQR